MSALHKGPDGLSRNVEGRDQLILSKSTECDYLRDRIKGIQTALRDGTAEDEEQEARTVDKVPVKELEPFPHAKGLAVSLNYERKSQEHKYGGTARGDESKGDVPSKNYKKKVHFEKNKMKIRILENLLTQFLGDRQRLVPLGRMSAAMRLANC